LADLGRVEFAAPFHEKRRGLLLILVRGDRSKKVARIGEAICPDRSAIGKREGAAVVFAHIGARRAIDEFDSKHHAALDHADLARLDVDHAEFGAEAKLVVLRACEELASRLEAL